MGANVAPAYANIYMDSYENTHVYNNALFCTYCRCWLRFIDDIFCLWTGPHDILLTFTEYLNSIWPELQITLNCDSTQISFLDTLVTIEPDGSLSTDIFSKPTDSNSLLHYQSCHPTSTKHSLPRSQFKRVACTVSKPDLVPERLDEMSRKFTATNYPKNLLDREKLLATSPASHTRIQPKSERVPFVHTHHPVMPRIYNVIRKHCSESEQDTGSDVPAEQTPLRPEENGRPQLRRIEIPPVQQRKLDS
ncbi:unnamed protein product [Ranitomeya imitator]|uniref:Reverse transcriptase domain-containing protein n=1 Tax=Ranitomeya imitator TaxID=111125 RepID=A0ABN9MD57_9NEOB|nr:unnamed protein product [Ranitomeya imitator]